MKAPIDIARGALKCNGGFLGLCVNFNVIKVNDVGNKTNRTFFSFFLNTVKDQCARLDFILIYRSTIT